MFTKISQYLCRISTAPVLFVSFLILLIFVFFIVPDMAQIMDVISSGLGSPDRLFYYDAEKLLTFAKAYGNDGRHAYVRTRISHDIAWPLVYAGFFCLVISYANTISIPRNSRFQRLNLIPLVPLFFDALENLIISIVMLSFPKTWPLLNRLAGITTAAKWCMVILSIFACICAIGYMLLKLSKFIRD
nr:hypothetical protein [uncultured Desulfobacter sp.]